MTLSCPACGCTDVTMVADNGAEYPQTRVEFYQCVDCSERFREVLTA
ncbi:hypothetical protein GRX03_12025 [Halovenus sp. WSH3]|uniref:Small CPxCG-related zinc finger protein n=1 Tax=Halovenus carboxidivorans TaxID=2692199 RepID=A0A6B0T5X7_9EURY|nr:hypothetical protein [Halovenus carboxidivorans]MXR52327.1 hypothetical protein [Halovenus carboxidivorans]